MEQNQRHLLSHDVEVGGGRVLEGEKVLKRERVFVGRGVNEWKDEEGGQKGRQGWTEGEARGDRRGGKGDRRGGEGGQKWRQGGTEAGRRGGKDGGRRGGTGSGPEQIREAL